MKFFAAERRIRPSNTFNLHMLFTGLFIGLSYVLLLLPLSLFAIAQTLAIYGKKSAIALSGTVVVCLVLLAIVTGSSPMVMGAVFSFITIPLFLIVSILRQKRKALMWSAGILFAPIFIFFGLLVSAPVLNPSQYNSVLTELQKNITTAQSIATEKDKALNSSAQNQKMYERTIEQIEFAKRDLSLQKFVSQSATQRLAYFIYGNGFALSLGVLLSFFASLFFLDFSFEQVEKLHAIKRYVRSLSRSAFDATFLALLDSLKVKNQAEQSNDETVSFKIFKHLPLVNESKPEKRVLFGLIRVPNPKNTISFRNFVFYYTGHLPGWNLRAFQMPLILCLLGIAFLAGTLFYFGDTEHIFAALQSNSGRIFPFFLVSASLLSLCVLAFLILQGVFTTLKWLPFGVLLALSLIFFLVTPYMKFDMGPFVFLSVFGVIGLLGYAYDFNK